MHGPAQGKTKPTCAKCTSGFLHTPEGGETSCPNSCPDGYFGHTSAESGSLKTCQSCSAPKDGLNPAVTGGIPGCTQCTYAAASTNTLKCTACGSGYKLEGEACVPASTNKSGLSTGAIAGISVAVIVAVGGERIHSVLTESPCRSRLVRGTFTFSPEEASSYQSRLREIQHPKLRMPLDSGGGGLLRG